MANKLDVARGGRLCAAMDRAGVSNLELAQVAGVSSSTVTLWRKGAAIRCEHLAAICPHLDISIDHLVAGRQSPDPRELRLLHCFRSLDPRIAGAVLRLAEELAQSE